MLYDVPLEIHFDAVYNILRNGWPLTQRPCYDDTHGWGYIYFGLTKDPFYGFKDYHLPQEGILKTRLEEKLRRNLSVKVDSALSEGRVESKMLAEMLLQEEWWPIPGRLFASKWRGDLTLWYLNIYKELRDKENAG